MDAGRFEDGKGLGEDPSVPRWPTESEAAFSAGERSDDEPSRNGSDEQSSGDPTYWRRRFGRPPRPHPIENRWAASVTESSDRDSALHDPGGSGSVRGPSEFNTDDFADRLQGGPMAELYAVDDRQFLSVDDSSPVDSFAAAVPEQAHVEATDQAQRLTTGMAEQDQEESGLVRPYFRTQGRTRPTHDLAVETLISTSDQGKALERVAVPEHRSICGLCVDARSVAEVASHLRLPLGVARVLIGDVAGLGLVRVHSGSLVVGDRPSIEFMERVLSGLRRI